ncbi:hypothetical protein [Malonomonas rubra]|uniref:hypothetical protein n=1 Tax=Malonomonas rubra TaxID=57040 RepID=UPI001114C1FC|nr:hypothetical protein [Malonomonas rubra]
MTASHHPACAGQRRYSPASATHLENAWNRLASQLEDQRNGHRLQGETGKATKEKDAGSKSTPKLFIKMNFLEEQKKSAKLSHLQQATLASKDTGARNAGNRYLQ